MVRRNFERVRPLPLPPTPFEVVSTAARGSAAVLVGVLAIACGDDNAPAPRPAPSSEVVRDAYGLNPGNCYRYESGNLGSIVKVEGPNTTSIVGRTVYEWSFRPQSSTQREEWLLDTESDGAVRLLRSVETVEQGGQPARATRDYTDTGAPPLFYQIELDSNGTVFRPDSAFTTEVTPACSGAGCPDPIPQERHEWQVTGEGDVPTPDGMLPGVNLLYRRTIAGETESATYALVPGRGFAQIRTFAGDVFQACNWRYCDANGENCAGAASCDDMDLRCN